MSAIKDAARVAQEAAQLLQDHGWIAGTPAINGAGSSVEARDPNAVAWSCVGAIDKVTDDVEVRRLVIRAASIILHRPAHKWELTTAEGKDKVIELLRRVATELGGE